MNFIQNILLKKWATVFVLVVFIFLLLHCSQEPSLGNVAINIPPPQKDSVVIIDSIKDLELPFFSPQEQIVRHTTYTLSYSEPHEQAKWVAYKLSASMIAGETKRKNDFRADLLAITGSAEKDDYVKSGFDRGHLCPAADRKFSEEAMSETFFMSNMSPQKPYFNRGIWKKLEEQVRDWATKNEEVFVVTGGLLENDLPKIGKTNKISVPVYYYKIILDAKEPQVKAIAFLMKNEKSEFPLSNFTVTIDSVEKITGIDFFPLLPDSLENLLESKSDFENW